MSAPRYFVHALPEELWLLVCELLPVRTKLGSLTHVCRQSPQHSRALMAACFFSSHLHITTRGQLATVTAVAASSRHLLNQLAGLTIDIYQQQLDCARWPSALDRACLTRLVTLTLCWQDSEAAKADVREVVASFGSIPHLRSLSLSLTGYAALLPCAEALVQLSALQSVHLDGWELDESSLVSLLSAPCMRALDLSLTKLLLPDGMHHGPSWSGARPPIRTLRSLHLPRAEQRQRYCSLLEWLGAVHSLADEAEEHDIPPLSLQTLSFRTVDEMLLRTLQCVPSVTALRVGALYDATVGLVPAVAPRALQPLALPRLRHLSCFFNGGYAEPVPHTERPVSHSSYFRCVALLRSVSSQLSSLQLCDCEEPLDDEVLSIIAYSCPRLVALKLHGAQRLRDLPRRAGSVAFPAVRRLRLDAFKPNSLEDPSDAQLIAFTSSFLSLKDCELRIDDVSLLVLRSLSQLPHLCRLRFA